MSETRDGQRYYDTSLPPVETGPSSHVGPKTASRLTHAHIEHKLRQSKHTLAGWLEKNDPDAKILHNINYWQGYCDSLASLLDY